MNRYRIFIGLFTPAVLAGSLAADEPPAAEIAGLRRAAAELARECPDAIDREPAEETFGLKSSQSLTDAIRPVS
jgi:hypothetical protein